MLLPSHASALAGGGKVARRRVSLRAVFWLIALALGAYQAWLARNSVNYDGLTYLDMADAIARGDWANGINAFWSPLYPAIIALAFRLAHPDRFVEAIVVHVVNFAIYLVALGGLELVISQVLAVQRRHASEAAREGRVVMGERSLRVVAYGLFLLGTLRYAQLSLVTPDLLVFALALIAAGLLLLLHRQTSETTGRGSWLVCIAAGFVLGAAYLAKTPMFLIAGAFLAAPFVRRSGRSRAMAVRVVAASAAFVVVAAPLVVTISLRKGRLTFGESGRLNYAGLVNGAPRTMEWQGRPSAFGVAAHPARQISEHPAVYEFASPVGGTYPAYFDPSYWEEGMHPRFNLRQQLLAIARGAAQYGQLVGPFLLVWTLVAFAGERRSAIFTDLCRFAELVVPAAFALGMYALINVEGRYVAPFVVMLLLGAFAALSLPASQVSGRVLRGSAYLVCAVALAVTAYRMGQELKWFMQDVAAERSQRPVAAALRRRYVSDGDAIGVIGIKYGLYWARLARVRVIAAIPPSEAATFWWADTATRNRVLGAFAATGAKLLVTDNAPGPAPPPGWQQIDRTPHVVFDLRQWRASVNEPYEAESARR